VPTSRRRPRGIIKKRKIVKTRKENNHAGNPSEKKMGAIGNFGEKEAVRKLAGRVWVKCWYSLYRTV
jgi:hypothetical protein